ncbi:MAG TPA: hypothetical protein V6D19_14495 [Stenomitos sp.]
MTTQFITLELDLETAMPQLRSAIESQLVLQGEPLRWAIAAVNEGIVRVEAVVLQAEETTAALPTRV